MGTRRVVIEFLGQDKSASKTAKGVEDATGKLGSTMASVGKAAAIGLGGGLLAAGAAAVKFTQDAEESRRVGKLTEQVVKSTGGVAKITAEQVGDLATAISNKTGADDEAIQSGSNLLLTFTNVRNETGKNNDIFNQATSMVTDMTAALNGGAVTAEGMKGSSIQLGKALNDPIKGVGALSKVGVSFTEQQKKQIKEMVKSGDVLGAQKVILAELSKEFGGAAAAAASPMDRLRTAAGNVGEELGSFLLPVADKLFTFLAANAAPTMEKLHGWVNKTWPVVRELATQIGEYLFPKLQVAGNFITQTVVPALVKMAKFVGDNKEIFGLFAKSLGVIILAVKAWTMAQAALNLVLSLNPLGLVVIALAAAAAGLIYAYRHSEQFRKYVDAAFKIAAAAGKFMWDTVLKPIFQLLVWSFKNVWEAAQKFAQITSAAWGAIKEPARAALKFVVDRMFDFIGSMLDAAAKAFGWVPGLGPKLKDAAKNFKTFRTDVNNALDGIKDEPVDIKVGLAYTQALGQKTKQMKFGDGGGVPGRERGKDSVPALLMPDEHVWTTDETAAVGGHGAMKRLRMAALAGKLRGLATGGRAGLGVGTQLPSLARVRALTGAAAGDVDDVGSAIAKSIGKQLATQLAGSGPAGPAGSVQGFRGVKLNARTISMVQAAERILGSAFHITQGSYSTSVAASGSTHSGGGAMDTNGPGGWGTAQAALRRVGFAAWHRTPAMGPWGHHIHSIAIGDSTASPAAKRQVADFLRGGDGLGSYQNGTDFVPETGLYRLHKGEKVTPAAANSGELGTVRFELELDGKIIQTKLLRLKKLNGGLALGLA